MLIDKIKKDSLAFGEMILLSWKILKSNKISLLLVTLLIFIPINIVTEIVSGYITNITQNIDLQALANSEALFRQFVSSKEYYALYIYELVFLGIQIFFVPFGVMATAKIACDSIYGGKADHKVALMKSFSKCGIMFLTTIIYAVGLTLGMFAFIVPAIFLSMRWYFYLYSIALDDQKFMGALGKSSNLVKERWFSTFRYAVLIFLLHFGISIMIQMFFIVGGYHFVLGVITRTMLSFVSVFFYIVTTVWYLHWDVKYNHRQQKPSEIAK